MDYISVMRSLFALLFVLGLIVAVAWMWRRFVQPQEINSFKKTRRLSVIQSIMLDGRNKLALIKRDDQEHLILISQTGNLIIEKNITAESPAHHAPTARKKTTHKARKKA